VGRRHHGDQKIQSYFDLGAQAAQQTSCEPRSLTSFTCHVEVRTVARVPRVSGVGVDDDERRHYHFEYSAFVSVCSNDLLCYLRGC